MNSFKNKVAQHLGQPQNGQGLPGTQGQVATNQSKFGKMRSLFDFPDISRRALGRHWTDRTPAEREEFTRLFTDLIARTYIGKIDRYAGESIAYVGEHVDGDEASVRSRVVTAKGSQIPVEYRLHRANVQLRSRRPWPPGHGVPRRRASR